MPGTTGRFCLVHSYIFIEEVFKLLFSKEGIHHFKYHAFFFGFQFPDHFNLFHQCFILCGNFLRCRAVEVYNLVNCHPEIPGNFIECIHRNLPLPALYPMIQTSLLPYQSAVRCDIFVAQGK